MCDPVGLYRLAVIVSAGQFSLFWNITADSCLVLAIKQPSGLAHSKACKTPLLWGTRNMESTIFECGGARIFRFFGFGFSAIRLRTSSIGETKLQGAKSAFGDLNAGRAMSVGFSPANRLFPSEPQPRSVFRTASLNGGTFPTCAATSVAYVRASIEAPTRHQRCKTNSGRLRLQRPSRFSMRSSLRLILRRGCAGKLLVP